MLSRLFALLVLLALIAGGLYYWKLQPAGARRGDLGGMAQGLEDAKTTASVKAAFGLSRRLKGLSLAVSTREGTVELGGRVPSSELRELAERTARAVPGVDQVRNAIEVSGDAAAAAPAESGGRSIGETLDDEGLEVQVKLAFSLNRNLAGSDIQVTAFRRELALAGEVSGPEQHRLALEIARETPGVASVTDGIRVRSTSPGPASRNPPAPADPLLAVRKALAENPNLPGGTIDVRLQGGRVVLRGHVRSGAEKDLAGLLAREAAGSPVENALDIRP